MAANMKIAIGAGALMALCGLNVTAAELCVNPHGSGGCASTISGAVSAASPNDVIRVARGTYHETVTIGIPLSLIGESAKNTVIDATNLLNGINVDGHGHPDLAHVIVSGFTVRNANAQGILVTNASDVMVSNNHVTGNDRSLDAVNLQCPPLPEYFQAGEAFDCGEGIHLSGVDHSTVSANLVNHNAGGILLSDDTGLNHDNLVSGNIVQDNPLDCGITIAAHNPGFAVSHNTIVGNTSARNGTVSGEGAGVGIFAGAPGAHNDGNVVADNILTGNGLPGVALHSHLGGQTLNDHLIVGNTIWGNGPDGDPGTTVPTGISVSNTPAGPPITGVVISHNVIKGEDIGIAVNAAGSVAAHFNSLFAPVGVDNLGSGTIDATENWWKCPGGPDAHGCGTVSNASGTVTYEPWLTKPVLFRALGGLAPSPF